MNKEIETRLPSGITVYRYGNPDSHSFYISLFVKAGSMYESEEDSGITHFLEHVIIRNVNAVMEGGLYPLLDRYGIEFNASTYSEMVQFYVSGAAEHFDVGVDIISRVLSPIILSPKEISAEAARIRAEIRENDERSSLSGFTSEIIHSGTTLARSITGTPTSVRRITRTRLERYRKEVFTRDNVFLYLSGRVGEREELRLADVFSKISLENGVIRDNVAPVSRNFGKREPMVYIKNADYTMLRFTFDMDMSRIRVEESDLLYDTLLGGYSSRLFIELSEKRGIFYDISGATERYANIGSFSFFFEVKAGDVTDAVREGESIVTPMSTCGVFPPMMISMVDVGEETGQLPDMLMKVAEVYDEEVDNSVTALTAMLEPLMIVFLAVVVGSIVMAMFMPMMEVIKNV